MVSQRVYVLASVRVKICVSLWVVGVCLHHVPV